MNKFASARFITFTLSGFLLAACSTEVAPQPASLQSTAPLAIAVHEQSETHAVPLATDGRPTAFERDRLNAFVADLARSRPDALHATISGTAPRDTLLDIEKTLVSAGVDPQKITFAPAAAGAAPRSIVVAVVRYVADPPPCAPWGVNQTASGLANGNPAPPELGCTDLVNLSVMVADPHDLVKGSSSPYGSGETAANAVGRYRADRVKPFIAPGGFGPGGTSGGGSSGGGN
jgi:pilus assembly protein CpaD